MKDNVLRLELRDYSFDAARGIDDFVARLAKQEKWSADSTESVVEEYRKFLYLTQVNPEPSTPSRAIDRAWHFHLAHTRDNWERLCADILGRRLHHDATCRFQETEFGFPRPPDVWYPSEYANRGKTSAKLLLTGLCILLFEDLLQLRFNEPVLAEVFLAVGMAMAIKGFVGVIVYADTATRNSRSGTGVAHSDGCHCIGAE